MNAVRVIINKNFDFEIKNNTILIIQKGTLIDEFAIPEVYKINLINEGDDKNTVIIMTLRKLDKPKYIPNNYSDLTLTSCGLYIVKDNNGRMIYYIASTIYDNLYLSDYQKRFSESEFQIPKSFWFSYDFRENLMRLAPDKLNAKFALHYAQEYDGMNRSRIISKNEFEFLKYQKFYARKFIDEYGLTNYKLSIDFYIEEYLKKGKNLTFYLEFPALNFENWQYLVFDEKKEQYYLAYFNDSNYYMADKDVERIWSIPVIEDTNKLVLRNNSN